MGGFVLSEKGLKQAITGGLRGSLVLTMSINQDTMLITTM